MKLIALAALLALTVNAIEVEMVARSGGDVIRLRNRPCVHAGTLALIPADQREKWRMARAMVEGHDYFACWIVDGDSAHLLYEDGDQGLIPLTNFKLDPGA